MVKEGMGHKELTLEEYSSIWQECDREVLYVPSQNRYTRASMASNKDRLESMEKRLQNNRQLMTKQAKKAAKLEKKLKVLTGGYHARAVALAKQVGDLHEQVEQSSVELETFRKLEDLEQLAIPKRHEVCVCVCACVCGWVCVCVHAWSIRQCRVRPNVSSPSAITSV